VFRKKAVYLISVNVDRFLKILSLIDSQGNSLSTGHLNYIATHYLVKFENSK